MLTSDSTSLPYRVAKEANEASPKVGLLHEVGVTLTTLGEPGRTIESFRNKVEVNKWVSRAATVEWKRGVAQSTRLCDTYQGATHLRLRGYLRAGRASLGMGHVRDSKTHFTKASTIAMSANNIGELSFSNWLHWFIFHLLLKFSLL